MNYNWNSLLGNVDEVKMLGTIVIDKSKRNYKKILGYQVDRDKDKIIKILFDDIYEVNRLYALAGLAQLITKNDTVRTEWINIEKNIKQFNEEIKKDGKYLEKFIFFLKINPNFFKSHYENFVFNKLIEFYGNNNAETKTKQQHRKLIRIINNKLESGLELGPGYEYKINRFNFENIFRYTHHGKEREKITKKITDSNEIYGDILRLILYRNKIARENGKKTYFEFINEEPPSTIIEFVNNILESLIDQYDACIVSLTDKQNIKNYSDLIHNSYKNKKFIEASKIVKIIMAFYEKKFNLTIKNKTIDNNRDNNKTWNNLCEIYEIYYKNELVNVIHFDLVKDNAHKPVVPVYINLTPRTNYPYVSQNTKIMNQESVIICGYGNPNELISFNEIKTMFYEIGRSILDSTVVNSYNFSTIDYKYITIIEHFLEYLFFSDDNAKMYSQEFVKEYFPKNKIINLINFVHNCVESIFDLTFNQSAELVSIIKSSVDNKNLGEKEYAILSKQIITDVFQGILDSYHPKMSSFMFLNPKNMYDIINSDSKRYYNIISKMFAHQLFKQIDVKNNAFEVFSALFDCKTSFLDNMNTMINKKENKFNTELRNIFNKLKTN